MSSDNIQVRVLHIITRFLKWGGADLNTYYSIQALEPERYKVDLVVGRDSHLDMLKGYDQGELVQINSLVRDPNPRLDPVALFRLYRFIRKRDYDIVHTHTGKAGVLGRMAARMAGVSVIIHGLHGSMDARNPILDKIYTYLDRFTGRFTDKFVSVGEDLKKKYIDRGVGEPGDYTVIHSGMELGEFRKAGRMDEDKVTEKKEELGVPEDAVVLGKVAGLEPRKGHKYLIQAAEKILEEYEEVYLLFVGDGWYRDEIERMVERSGVSNRVIFTGFREDIVEVMATFDIFVFTSLWEGLPQVLVQSAAEAIPIVTFEVEGADEVVDNGQNGFVVPSKDVDAFIDKVSCLIEDREKAREMGQRGPKKIGNKWSIEHMQEETLQLYEEIVEEHLTS